MAVYLRIVGFRKSYSLETEISKLGKILKDLKMELDFLDLTQNQTSNQPEWKLNITEYHKLYELSIAKYSINILFDNQDFIELICSHSGNYYHFVDKNNSVYTNGVLKIFRNVAQKYGIDELAYFSEWFFDPDDIRTKEATFEDLRKLMDENPDSRRTELWGLESNEYYIEKINPVANNGNRCTSH